MDRFKLITCDITGHNIQSYWSNLLLTNNRYLPHVYNIREPTVFKFMPEIEDFK